MAGRPAHKARKLAGVAFCHKCRTVHGPDEPCVPQFNIPPPDPEHPAHTRARDLLPQILTGATLGVDALVNALRAGLINGRDLAVVTGVLIDKAAKLEGKGNPDDVPSQHELEQAEHDAEQLLAEKRRRQGG